MSSTAFNIKSETDIISPTFCPVPWEHQYFETDGSESLCCRSVGSARGDMEWNGSEMREIRLNMLAGRKSNPCNMCYNEEKNIDGMSMRQQYISNSRIRAGRDMKYYRKFVNNVTDKDGRVSNQSSTLQISLGNTCTGQCVPCSPWNSSALRSLHKQINNNLGWDGLDVREFKWIKDNAMWEKKLYPIIERSDFIAVSGGEPFITKRTEQILEHCIEKNIAKDKILYYNTNCAQSIPNKIIELWKHFKHITINLSVDDVGERNNYIRYPVKWSQFLKFLNWSDNNEDDNISFELMPSIGNYNLYYYPDFIDWVIKQRFQKVGRNFGGMPIINIIHFPERCGIKTLPEKANDIIIEKYNKWFSKFTTDCDSNIKEVRDNFEWSLNATMQLPNLLQDNEYLGELHGQDHYTVFKQWHTELDKIRGTSFYDTFPIFKEFD